MADGGAVIVGGLMVEGALVVNRGAEVGGGYCPVCVCVWSVGCMQLRGFYIPDLAGGPGF